MLPDKDGQAVHPDLVMLLETQKLFPFHSQLLLDRMPLHFSISYLYSFTIPLYLTDFKFLLFFRLFI
jgi:hypothetical protein